MADKKISQLTALASPTTDDLLPVVDLADNTTKKATLASLPVSTATTSAIAVVQADVDAHEARTDNPHTVTKTQVGLSNVDNTSDLDKPVSTATQTALNAKADDSDITDLVAQIDAIEVKTDVIDYASSLDPYKFEINMGVGRGMQVGPDSQNTLFWGQAGQQNISAQGSGTDYDINLIPKGTGKLEYAGSEVATVSQVNAKQDTLVSGTNIKTINGNSVLGSGDLTISGV